MLYVHVHFERGTTPAAFLLIRITLHMFRHRIQQQKIQDASGEIAMDLAIMASKAKRAAFFSDLMPLTLKVPFNDLSSASRRSELEPGVPKPISELDSKDLLKLVSGLRSAIKGRSPD